MYFVLVHKYVLLLYYVLVQLMEIRHSYLVGSLLLDIIYYIQEYEWLRRNQRVDVGVAWELLICTCSETNCHRDHIDIIVYRCNKSSISPKTMYIKDCTIAVPIMLMK